MVKMKKKISFIFSGQIRSNPFGHDNFNKNFDISVKILKSYKQIFNEKIKSIYDYRVYISTDNLLVEETINFFGKNNIGNIHLFDTEYYYKKIKNKIPQVDFYLSNYSVDPPFQKYDNSIHQYYKLYDSFNLFLNDDFNDVDYIIRLRLDTSFDFLNNQDFCSFLNLLDLNDDLQILMYKDLFAIGKKLSMETYCTAINKNYGKNKFEEDLGKIKYPFIIKEYYKLERNRWTYAPEIQLYFILFKYCKENNYNINKALLPIDNLNVNIKRNLNNYIERIKWFIEINLNVIILILFLFIYLFFLIFIYFFIKHLNFTKNLNILQIIT